MNRVGHEACAPISPQNRTERFLVIRLKHFNRLTWWEQPRSNSRTAAHLIFLLDNSGKLYCLRDTHLKSSNFVLHGLYFFQTLNAVARTACLRCTRRGDSFSTFRIIDPVSE